jgi:hypothetical protein
MPQTITELRAIVEDWIEAWNAHDLDRIMSHYADDVEFEANTVVKRWNKPDGKLRGINELREHFKLGLSLAPQIHFTFEQFFSVPSGYAVLYRRDNGNQVMDVVELNEAGKARRVKAFYSGDQK